VIEHIRPQMETSIARVQEPQAPGGLSQSSEPSASFCRAAKGLPQKQNRWPR
jgi:hypothetical protein